MYKLFKKGHCGKKASLALYYFHTETVAHEINKLVGNSIGKFRVSVGHSKHRILVHVPNFGGCQCRRTGGGDNSIQFINCGRVGDKSFKEWRQKIGGGRVGDNNILTFLSYCTQ